MTIQWSAHLTDRLIGPQFSKLTAFSVPEVPEVPNYHGSLFLNHAFNGLYDEHFVRYLMRFMRKLTPAVRDYRSARENLQTCFTAMAQSNEQITAYLKAISDLEACIQHLHPGLLCLWSAGQVRKLPTPALTDDYRRLRLLCNRCKHFNEDFERSERAGDKSAPIAAIWIDNGKVTSVDLGGTIELSFQELADILLSAMGDAKDFSETVMEDIRKARLQSSSAVKP